MSDKNSEMHDRTCGYKTGALEECAPLAAAYVPAQGYAPPMYDTGDALTKGTLFPGLDLPFKNISNGSNPYEGTPLGELMALDFVIKELNLYLDTHPNDREAFDLLKRIVALQETGRKKYMKLYGPVLFTDVVECGEFNWLNSPWPWEYAGKAVEK